MNRFLLLALATVSLTATAASAAPVSPPVADRISVKFGDLNLSRERDARVLVSRIRVAAKELCGPDVAGDIGRTIDRGKCIREVQDQAIKSVNRPTVTAAYRGRPSPNAFAQAGSAQ